MEIVGKILFIPAMGLYLIAYGITSVLRFVEMAINYPTAYMVSKVFQWCKIPT